MSLSVQSLNGDSTFLLTFRSESTSSTGQAYTILVDPWLDGASTIWHSRFQISHHSNQPLISSLADLETPDLILISQDKPDHCHEATLKTLPADSPVRILATPAAAKRIKSWRYFTHATITSMPTFNPKNHNTVLRFPVRPTKSTQDAGAEVTVSHIPQRLDMTSLHNAIGITFTPGTSPHISHDSTSAQLPLSPPLTPTSTQSRSQSPSSLPLTPLASSRPLSVLYAPHSIGVPCITPYMNTFLAPRGALPLTALFHCITVERNPWFLGGAVCPGLPAGEALVRHFGARYWLSAHDEPKHNSGWATVMIKTSRFTLDEAQMRLDEEAERGDRDTTTLVGLGVGEERSMTA